MDNTNSPNGSLPLVAITPARKRPRLTVDEKMARLRTEEEQRDAKRKAKEEARAARRRAAQPAAPAHLAKVAKAQQKLAPLSDSEKMLFESVVSELNNVPGRLALFGAYLGIKARALSTVASRHRDIRSGDRVQVIAPTSRFYGCTGVVTKAAEIRAYVRFDGADPEAPDGYFFLADLAHAPEQDAEPEFSVEDHMEEPEVIEGEQDLDGE